MMKKLYLTLAAFLVISGFMFPHQARAAVAFNASSTANCLITVTTCNSITTTLNVGALSSTLIVIGLYGGGGSGDAADTLNGVSVNGIRATRQTAFPNGNTGGYVSQWTFVATTSGNTVINATTTTVSANDNLIIYGAAYDGVDTSSPVEVVATSTGSGTTASVTVTGASDTSMVVDVHCAGSAFGTVGAGQTQRVRNNINNLFSCNNLGYSEQLGSVAGDVMSWTISVSDSWRSSGIALRASSVITPATYSPRVILRRGKLLLYQGKLILR